jgi:hypothetical protein
MSFTLAIQRGSFSMIDWLHDNKLKREEQNQKKTAASLRGFLLLAEGGHCSRKDKL